jgi:hypothetical protein
MHAKHINRRNDGITLGQSVIGLRLLYPDPWHTEGVFYDGESFDGLEASAGGDCKEHLGIELSASGLPTVYDQAVVSWLQRGLWPEMHPGDSKA